MKLNEYFFIKPNKYSFISKDFHKNLIIETHEMPVNNGLIDRYLQNNFFHISFSCQYRGTNMFHDVSSGCLFAYNRFQRLKFIEYIELMISSGTELFQRYLEKMLLVTCPALRCFARNSFVVIKNHKLQHVNSLISNSSEYIAAHDHYICWYRQNIFSAMNTRILWCATLICNMKHALEIYG